MRRWMLPLGLVAWASVAALPSGALAQQGEDAQASPAADGDRLAEFKLLDAGEDPQVRRYRLTPGDSVTLRLINDVQMSMDMGMGFQGEPLPTTEQFLTMHVRDVDAEGVSRLEAIIERARVTPGQEVDRFVRDAMEEGLSPFRGVRMRFKMDARGRGSDEVVTGPDGVPLADPQIRQSMEETMQASGVPLPEEAFGVGAVWLVRETVSINGVTMQRESTHTVEEIDGERMTVRSRVKVTTEPHDVKNDALSPGVRVRIEETDLSGTGTSTFSLRSLRTTFDVLISGEIRMTVFDGEQEIKIHQRLSMGAKAQVHEGPLPDAQEGQQDGPAF